MAEYKHSKYIITKTKSDLKLPAFRREALITATFPCNNNFPFSFSVLFIGFGWPRGEVEDGPVHPFDVQRAVLHPLGHED